MFLLGILSLLYGSVEGISCKGPRNTNVDWFVFSKNKIRFRFIVYKPPKGGDASGKNFFYLDSNNPSWTQPPGSIGDDNQPLGATISQIYSADHVSYSLQSIECLNLYLKKLNSEQIICFYVQRRQPAEQSKQWRPWPRQGSRSLGQQTGLLADPQRSELPSSQYSIRTINLVFRILHVPGDGGQVRTDLPMCHDPRCLAGYGRRTPPLHTSRPLLQYPPRCFQIQVGCSPILEENRLRFPVLQDIVNKHSLPSSTTVFAKTQMLQTDRGDHFMAFAKHRKFAKGGRRNSWYTSKESDIWLSLVANELRSPLAVQGWLNGASGDLKTDCSTPYNVRY